MPFGKYKGIEVYELEDKDPGYIVWLNDSTDLFGELELCVKEMYPRCKKKKYKGKRSTVLWTDDDIASMEADLRDEYGYDDYSIFYDDIPMLIPNFDY